MNDFLTRVAERALGTAPRITPQAMSIYEPARLPLSELPAAEVDSAPVSKSRDMHLEQHEKILSRPVPVVTEVAAKDDEAATHDENALSVKPEPIGVTALRNKRTQLPSLTLFEQEAVPTILDEEPHPVPNSPTAADFESRPTKELSPAKELDPAHKRHYQRISNAERVEVPPSHQPPAMQTVESNPAFAESLTIALSPGNIELPSQASSPDRNNRELPGDITKQDGRVLSSVKESPPLPRIASPDGAKLHSDETPTAVPC